MFMNDLNTDDETIIKKTKSQNMTGQLSWLDKGCCKARKFLRNLKVLNVVHKLDTIYVVYTINKRIEGIMA